MTDVEAAAKEAAAAAAQATQQDKLFDEIQQQNQNFEHYEKLFQEVLMDLEGDEILETFHREYESLHNSFLKCHEGEKRLIKKCVDLAQEIHSCQMRVRSAEDLTQGDVSTIEQLRKEISKARSKIEQSRETEVTLKEKIKQLKVEIKDLDKQVEKGAVGVVGHDTTLSELGRVRMELQKEHDTQNGQLVAIQHDINHLQNRVAKAEGEKTAQEKDFQDLRDMISGKNNELDDQRARKDRKERELKGLKEDLARHNKEMLDNQATILTTTAKLNELEETLAKTKHETERVVKEYESINKKTRRYEVDLEDLIEKNQQSQVEISTLHNQLKVKENEVGAMRREVEKQVRLTSAINKRNSGLEIQRADAETSRNTLRLSIQQMELDIASGQKHVENDRKQIEDLTRERDILNKNYLKAQSSTQRQKDWLIIKENQRRNLDHQIRGYENHAKRQREMLHQLQKEAETYEKDASDSNVRFARALDEVKNQDQLIVREQKNIQESEAKLKQQQGLFETVLNERNLYSKNLLELHGQINEMKRKFKIMIGHIKQLKEEIQMKEKQLVDEEKEVKKQKKLKSDFAMTIDAWKKKTEKRHRTIDAYAHEIHKLNQIIVEAEAEKSKQQRDHINVMNERDILGAQLIRRNDELAQLYEKIRIQQSSLRKGEAQYSARLNDIQHLNTRVSQLQQELGLMKDFASRLPDLKLQVNKAGRELQRERLHVRSLLDECDNPLNVHRWRVAEGSDPAVYDTLQKIHALQRELIAKNNEVSQKEKLIAEKEKLYVELKGIISRQPGPEVAEQLNVYQDNLAKKTSQMRAMKASLKHFQEQVETYQSRFEDLSHELGRLKKDFVKSKRRMRKDDEKRAILAEMLGKDPNDVNLNEEDKPQVYVGFTAPPRPTDGDPEGTNASIPPLPEGADLSGFDPDATDGSMQSPSEQMPADAGPPGDARQATPPPQPVDNDAVDGADPA